LTPEERKATG
jgi:ATP-binding cassette, subfamily G (WHITE), eye pigment precursor transporter